MSFALANNYDASSDGTYPNDPIEQPFTGTFTGLGNAISNLNISDNTEQNVGLFNELQPTGIIRDLTLLVPTVTSAPGGGANPVYYQGALVGYSVGTLLDDSVSASQGSNPSISSSGFYLKAIGGLVGWAAGTIANCSVSGAHVQYSDNGANGGIFAGGLAGEFGEGSISYSNANASVTAHPSSPAPIAAAGLVGYFYSSAMSSSITQSFATGTVSGVDGFGNPVDVGGLIGSQSGDQSSVNDSYASAYVSASTNGGEGNAGGLIGADSGGAVSGSYATGAVSDAADPNQPIAPFAGNTGGLIGYLSTDQYGNGGTVTYSYASGAVSIGDSNDVGGNEGGLVGWADAGTPISGSYAQGSVTGYGASVGGLVGLNDSAISSSYADPVCTSQNCTALIASLDDQIPATVGGLVGLNEFTGTISESFSAPVEGSNTTAISGVGSSSAGGLVGYNYGSIGNSYSYPSYSISCPGCAALIAGGSSSNVGGLVGTEDSTALISSSYSTGSVVGGSSNVGGSIGFDGDTNNGSKQYVYWDTNTSGTNCAAGNNGCSSDLGITGETTAQLTSGLPTGFGSPPWGQVGTMNGGFPCLSTASAGCPQPPP